MEWNRRVLILEDEAFTGSLISEVLRREGFTVRHCQSAVEARDETIAFDPDVAILDINLGQGPSGIQFGQWLHRTHPHVALVFLTRTPDPKTIGGSAWDIPDGSAFLAKESVVDVQLLVQAVDDALLQQNQAPRHDKFAAGPLSKLTPIQFEILRLAAEGYTNQAIAEKRQSTQRTVEQRLQAACRALGIEPSANRNPRAQAIRIFVESGGMLSYRASWSDQ